MDRPNKNLSANDQRTDEQIPPQNKWHMRFNYAVLLIVFSLIILVSSYFISPLSRIQKFVIRGNEGVVEQEVLAASNLKMNQSIFDVWHHENKTAKKIERLPQVQHAEVALKNWNEVHVKLYEHKTVAYMPKGEKYRRVLENGVILNTAYVHSIGNQPLLNHFKEGKALDKMIAELEKLDPNVLHMISEIEYLPEHANPLFVQVFMNNGNRVLASIPEFSEKMNYYPEMVKLTDNQKGIFDMEVGVYFIPFLQYEKEDGSYDYMMDEDGQYYWREDQAYPLEDPTQTTDNERSDEPAQQEVPETDHSELTDEMPEE